MIKLNEILIEKIKNRSAKICIVGLGYVGLPTAVFFAEKGFHVIGCDIKESFVELVNSGNSPLEDLKLGDRIAKIVSSGAFFATTNTREAVEKNDIILIIVPTPTGDGFEPDLSYIISAGESVAKGLHRGHLVILESTVYPGVTEEVLKPILEKSGLKAGVDFGLAYCPERYNPGDEEHTIDKVTRVLGSTDKQWAETAAELYGCITNVYPVANIKTAEMAKIIENAQRDLNIALMNEIALICERMGLDVMEVIKAAATKWNFHVYYPGAGVGGHCLPKDPWYLVKAAEKHGYHAEVITAGRRINDYMPRHMFELLIKAMNRAGKPIKGSKIVVLGLSYKENIGDIRNSPSRILIKEVKEMGGIVYSVDQYIDEKTAAHEFKVDKHFQKPDSVFLDADAIVLMTAHKEFEKMDFGLIKKEMRVNPVIVDGRMIYQPKEVKKKGFIYEVIGGGL
ncbi:nucleotide sugar dehydrogenase [Methanocella conradii]|uniref:nucleotide sugar dehydrogenase n=1 Tax=Methanocella conradii TaxID=1175444 RepID=UPI0024B38BB0|nr:nucleotide sugar dehydrogenase [Methanocella conradii]MDI6895985.1 nucleotide sugar dehydrogenase [Methanocella conradii]